jgi:hypothetical protein
MQRLLAIIGIASVSCGKVILKIHFEISMLYSALSKESIQDVPFLDIVSHKFLFHHSQALKRLGVRFLSHIVQEYLVLSGYTLIASLTSTLVLNISYHWGFDKVSCLNE